MDGKTAAAYLDLLAWAPQGVQGHFYRTGGGADIELLLVWPDGRLWAVEIKRNLAPRPERGFHAACAWHRHVNFGGGTFVRSQSSSALSCEIAPSGPARSCAMMRSAPECSATLLNRETRARIERKIANSERSVSKGTML